MDWIGYEDMVGSLNPFDLGFRLTFDSSIWLLFAPARYSIFRSKIPTISEWVMRAGTLCFIGYRPCSSWICVALFFARLSFGGRIEEGGESSSSPLLYDEKRAPFWQRFFLAHFGRLFEERQVFLYTSIVN